MKKLTLLVTGAALVAAGMTSCIKRETVEAEGSRGNGSAKITGYVLANTNTTNDTNFTYQFPYNDEFAPAGTKIIATYSTNDLNDGGAYAILNETAQVSTTVKSDGTYSLTIPANDNAVNVTIRIVEFITDCTVARQTSSGGNVVSTTVRKEFSGTTNVSVINGETRYQNIDLGNGSEL